jgi:alkanesulfonate monooxygenase SsuD/methylene tetrahydromethanopterin reductase-like flavin-dependent oxidoreductase (luciferase family)
VTEYAVIYSGTDEAPGAWAAAREAEGWSALAVPDHLWVNGQPIRHLWVTLTEMAAATSTVRLTSGFANNLTRSPVEFVQASLAVHAACHGRFDAGIGAGWDDMESAAVGHRFPPAGERSQRLGEAVQIARSLFDTGTCTFTGRWYTVDVGAVGPTPGPTGPPRLVAAATGARTVERVIDYVDLLELKAPAFSVPGKGTMDTRAAAELQVDDLRASVDRARALRPDVALSTFLPVGCTDDPAVGFLHKRLAGSVLAGLFGEPEVVATTLRDIAALGFDRLQIGVVTPGTPAALAPWLGRPSAGP